MLLISFRFQESLLRSAHFLFFFFSSSSFLSGEKKEEKRIEADEFAEIKEKFRTVELV